MFGYKKLKHQAQENFYKTIEIEKELVALSYKINQMMEILHSSPWDKVKYASDILDDNLKRLNTMANELKGVVAMQRSSFKNGIPSNPEKPDSLNGTSKTSKETCEKVKDKCTIKESTYGMNKLPNCS